MNRAATPFAVLLTIAATVTVWAADNEALYPEYYAAREALKRGDCATATEHLTAYLQRHPYIRERYREHYLEVRYAMEQCQGGTRIRGVDENEDALAPLPDHPEAEGEKP